MNCTKEPQGYTIKSAKAIVLPSGEKTYGSWLNMIIGIPKHLVGRQRAWRWRLVE